MIFLAPLKSHRSFNNNNKNTQNQAWETFQGTGEGSLRDSQNNIATAVNLGCIPEAEGKSHIPWTLDLKDFSWLWLESLLPEV